MRYSTIALLALSVASAAADEYANANLRGAQGSSKRELAPILYPGTEGEGDDAASVVEDDDTLEEAPGDDMVEVVGNEPLPMELAPDTNDYTPDLPLPLQLAENNEDYPLPIQLAPADDDGAGDLAAVGQNQPMPIELAPSDDDEYDEYVEEAPSDDVTVGGNQPLPMQLAPADDDDSLEEAPADDLATVEDQDQPLPLELAPDDFDDAVDDDASDLES